jgi:hypothetical protein
MKEPDTLIARFANPREEGTTTMRPKGHKQGCGCAVCKAHRSEHKKNPGHHKKGHPKTHGKKHHKKAHHRRNPGMPDMLMGATKAIAGGVLSAGVIFGGVKLAQKFPAKSKALGVTAQALGGIIAGGALGALGMPAAGAIVATTFAGTALATATAPPIPAGQVSGVMARGLHMAGVLNQGNVRGVIRGVDASPTPSVHRRPVNQEEGYPQRAREDSFHLAEAMDQRDQAQIAGIVQRMG